MAYDSRARRAWLAMSSAGLAARCSMAARCTCCSMAAGRLTGEAEGKRAEAGVAEGKWAKIGVPPGAADRGVKNTVPLGEGDGDGDISGDNSGDDSGDDSADDSGFDHAANAARFPDGGACARLDSM